ncbi:DUF2953 domain-containing protein [Lacrimispora sp. JR3]|uniref:DUF2953 domain-containing protein n=1 Tax=Lacrimispora sinapis TaxID=3111456 RepID=UPI0037490B19
MLHIILLILKIIGLLLLVILGLILTVLLLVLLVPIRYRGTGSYYGKGKGSVIFSWLLHILTVKVEYEGDVTAAVRLFGFRILKPKKIDEELKEAEDMVVHAMERVEPDAVKEAAEMKDDVQEEIKKHPDHAARTSEKRPPVKEKDSFFMTLWEKIKNAVLWFLLKIKFFFHRVYDTLRTVKEKKDLIYAWFSNEDNQRTVKLVIKQSKKLMRHVLPLKGKGTVTFGFDDPYLTGQVLMYASVVYPLCHKHLDLYPVFDETVFTAEGTFRGRIRLGTVLFIGLRMLMDKNFRILLKKWLR